MTNSKSSTKSSRVPSSRETSYFEGKLDFKWPSIMSGLNTRSPEEGAKAPVFKDTVFVKILEDGSLHQRKIIQKPLGSAKFLETLLSPFNISYPTVTNVVEDTIINRDGKTCWMWSRNLQTTFPTYMGKTEYEWLEISEKASYIGEHSPQGKPTYVYKKMEANSYLNGKLKLLGLPKLMTKNGANRWKTRSSGQIETLVQEITKICPNSKIPAPTLIPGKNRVA